MACAAGSGEISTSNATITAAHAYRRTYKDQGKNESGISRLRDRSDRLLNRSHFVHAGDGDLYAEGVGLKPMLGRKRSQRGGDEHPLSRCPSTERGARP